jgi:phosphoribosylamine--glycine ligase
VFHAGTANADSAIVTNGGRVWACDSLADDLAGARNAAYHGVEPIHSKGALWRTSLARALARWPVLPV